MSEFVTIKKISQMPWIPLRGEIDLTYRCNNNCRHCWLWIPDNSPQKANELTFDEIIRIVDEAIKMGCREWAISGGEPMLRDDFIEIFDYITSNSSSYSLNTNGTLITPKIANLMKKRGNKLIALYGATPQIHDQITRNPGSFELFAQGIAYLKEADVGFTVQIVPMKSNIRQYAEMISLAQSLSPFYRIGASWLHFSADGLSEKNKMIEEERLPPKQILKFDKPSMNEFSGRPDDYNANEYRESNNKKSILGACIACRREIHLDPYGSASFCCFIKDPSYRYNLRKGSLFDCWEKFLPNLSLEVTSDKEYEQNCGSCSLRDECLWCPGYAYLEHRRPTAKIEYLCQAALETKKFKLKWEMENRCFFGVGGLTIRLDSDIPLKSDTFNKNLKAFEINRPDKVDISIRHHFFLPKISFAKIGEKIIERGPLLLFKNKSSWIYKNTYSAPDEKYVYDVIAMIRNDRKRITVYHESEEAFRKGDIHSLSLYSIDQDILASVIAEHQGCFLHASAVELKGKGLVFAGHSEDGKSTIAQMLKNISNTICDERLIIRNQLDGYKIYGTWFNHEIHKFENPPVPLRAIFFLEKANDNRLIPVYDPKKIIGKLYSYQIKPFTCKSWVEKALIFFENLAKNIDHYILQFDTSDQVINLIEDTFGKKNNSGYLKNNIDIRC